MTEYNDNGVQADLNSFYVLSELRHSFNEDELIYNRRLQKLKEDTENLFSDLTESLANKIFDHIFISVIGETRHASNHSELCCPEIPWTSDRSSSYADAENFNPNNRNIDTLIKLYNGTSWDSAYGGKKWGNVISALKLRQKYGDVIFIDSVVHLQHNNGTVFSKPAVIYEIDSGFIFRYLNLKRDKEDLQELFVYPLFSQVVSLLERFGYRKIQATSENVYSHAIEEIPRPIFKIYTPKEYGDKILTLDDSDAYRVGEYTCDNCGENLQDYEVLSGSDGYVYCDECYGEKFINCTECGDVTELDESINREGYDYCEVCFNDKFASCYNCGDIIDYEDVKEFDGDYYCEICFDDKYVTCDNCGESVEQEDSHEFENNNYCEECFNKLALITDTGEGSDYNDKKEQAA